MTHIKYDVRVAGIKFAIVIFGISDGFEILKEKISILVRKYCENELLKCERLHDEDRYEWWKKKKILSKEKKILNHFSFTTKIKNFQPL